MWLLPSPWPELLQSPSTWAGERSTEGSGEEPRSSKPLVPAQLPNPLSLGTVPASSPEWVHPS